MRGVRGGSRNAFTVGNGHHLGATPGTWEEPGDRSLARVPGTGGGARHRQGQATDRPGAARPGKAPPSHTWRGLSLFCPAGTSCARTGTPATCRNASRDDPGHGPESTGQVPAAARQPEAVSAGAPAAGILARSDPGPVPGPRVRCAGCVRQALARRSAPAFQRGDRTAYLLAVHKHVDELCATALSLCVRAGRLGIPLHRRSQDMAFTWEIATCTLCIQRKRELSTCRASTGDK